MLARAASRTGKLSKRAVSYTPKADMPSESCRWCVHYRDRNSCSMVEGHINPFAWCDRFIKRAVPVPVKSESADTIE
jgi:hypothetical protein